MLLCLESTWQLEKIVQNRWHCKQAIQVFGHRVQSSWCFLLWNWYWRQEQWWRTRWGEVCQTRCRTTNQSGTDPQSHTCVSMSCDILNDQQNIRHTACLFSWGHKCQNSSSVGHCEVHGPVPLDQSHCRNSIHKDRKLCIVYFRCLSNIQPSNPVWDTH